MHMLILMITAPLALLGGMVMMILGQSNPLQPIWYTLSPYIGTATALIGLICFTTLIHGLLYDAWLDYKYGKENR